MNKFFDEMNVQIQIKIYQTVNGLKIVEFMRQKGPAHDYYTYCREFRDQWYGNKIDIEVEPKSEVEVTITEKPDHYIMEDAKNHVKTKLLAPAKPHILNSLNQHQDYSK